ncbi:MAG: aminoglycoside phosphotransferase family protein [Bacteroidales bacterium]|jgi:Ser/Thr protein kinase RdoA (MazF antagonist)|nr:aminoglycoside phosphotransferase family protein [Bacteroidales bacterium]
MKTIQAVFEQFNLEGTYQGATPYGSGHINDTWLVKTCGTDAPDYILQRNNPRVFTDIPRMLRNINRITEYLQAREPGSPNLILYPSLRGEPFVQDKEAYYWSAYPFIDGVSYNLVQNEQLALEGGKAWGNFLRQVKDFPIHQLQVTLPGFHNLQERLIQWESALENDNKQRANARPEMIDFVLSRKKRMLEYEQGLLNSSVPLRVTHNDTKFNNILFDRNDHYLTVIDLGTIMPGYMAYDFGDAIRTICNTSAEDETDLNKTSFYLPYFKAFTRGYLSLTQSFLTDQELDFLPFSPLFMTYLIGLRFFTDYLRNDIYFKTRYPEHNLQRARVQFQLLRSMEKQQPAMIQSIQHLRYHG